ncbi:MAG: dihydroxyacetone kinase, partial [Mycobacteriaceae bacterium]|nr:dihydroxyacetone kinase [Mycobacteriaceae bacterium]
RARVIEVDADRPGDDEQHFEVMFLIDDTDADRMSVLRKRLEQLGDSVVVVEDGSGTWSSHVHCRDAGAVIDAGVAAGTLRRVRITCFALEALRAPSSAEPGARGILAVVAGDQAARLFEAEGATVLRGDDPVGGTDLLAAIRAMPHREVLVLPNGALPAQDLLAVGVAARDGDRDVLMLPSSSMVQGLASLAVHDPGRIAVDDAFTMSEAAAGTRWGSLRVATERALTLVGTCAAGDGLGLVGREVVVVAPDPVEAGMLLIDRVLALGGELVTLLVGAQAPADLAERLHDHVMASHPGVDVVVYPGGQREDLLQLGVE